MNICHHESGTKPFWVPLRLPGQYFDAETELHENWHRYYDPVTGRYLPAGADAGGPGLGSGADCERDEHARLCIRWG